MNNILTASLIHNQDIENRLHTQSININTNSIYITSICGVVCVISIVVLLLYMAITHNMNNIIVIITIICVALLMLIICVCFRIKS
jgi:hypothetical protein